MGGISEKDWEALHENFDTTDLLSAVDDRVPIGGVAERKQAARDARFS